MRCYKEHSIFRKGLMESHKSLIIIPTYNEVENIDTLLSAIFSVVGNIHVLFVDDNSQDGTRDKIYRAQKKYSDQINILERESKLGLGTAYIQGFKWALKRDYQTIIEMDADLSHDPIYLTDMFGKLENYDGVFGSRYVNGGGTKYWGFWRRLISKGGSIYSRLILGIKYRDLTGGYNAWSRQILESLNLDEIKSEGYTFQIELKYRAHLAGSRLSETPIIFVDRRAGYSKMSKEIVFEAVKRVWALRDLDRKKLLLTTPQSNSEA